MQTEVNPISDTDVEADVFPTEDFDEGYEEHDRVDAPVLWSNFPAWREAPADATTLRTVTVANINDTGVNEMTQVCGRAGNNQRRKVIVKCRVGSILIATAKDVPGTITVVTSGGNLVLASTGITLDANQTYEHVSCEPLYAINQETTSTHLGILSVSEDIYFESGNA